MKKALNAWTVPGPVTMEELFPALRAAGFDGVELNIDDAATASPHALTLDMPDVRLREIRNLAEQNGIGIAGISSSLGGRAPLGSDDPQVRADGLALIRTQLRFAALLGADGILHAPGGHGDAVPLRRAYANVETALREIAPDAAAAGVVIGLENVWNNFFLSPFDMCRLIDAVASPFVAAYFDAGNVAAASDPAHWVDILGARIRKLHVKGYRRERGRVFSGTFCDLLDGDIRWAALTAALRTAGYAGYMTAELDTIQDWPAGLHAISKDLDVILSL